MYCYKIVIDVGESEVKILEFVNKIKKELRLHTLNPTHPISQIDDKYTYEFEYESVIHFSLKAMLNTYFEKAVLDSWVKEEGVHNEI